MKELKRAKKVFLEIWQNSQENTCARASFLIKARPATLLKVTLAQVFFYQFCNISKNNFFTEDLWATASEHKYWPGGISLKIEVLNISGNLKRR